MGNIFYSEKKNDVCKKENTISSTFVLPKSIVISDTDNDPIYDTNNYALEIINTSHRNDQDLNIVDIDNEQNRICHQYIDANCQSENTLDLVDIPISNYIKKSEPIDISKKRKKCRRLCKINCNDIRILSKSTPRILNDCHINDNYINDHHISNSVPITFTSRYNYDKDININTYHIFK
jgi:hypothetical protein